MEPIFIWEYPIGNSSSRHFCLDIPGFNLLLLGPDGHSCLERERPMDESEVKQALCDAYNDPSKQFGLLASDSGKLSHFHDISWSSPLPCHHNHQYLLRKFVGMVESVAILVILVILVVLTLGCRFFWGHERVLLAMLTQQCPWADAPDPTGELALCPWPDKKWREICGSVLESFTGSPPQRIKRSDFSDFTEPEETELTLTSLFRDRFPSFRPRKTRWLVLERRPNSSLVALDGFCPNSMAYIYNHHIPNWTAINIMNQFRYSLSCMMLFFWV